MYSGQTIEIQQAANGWIVILPMVANISGPDFTDTDFVTKYAKTLASAFRHEDDEIKKIQEDNELPMMISAPGPKKPESNIYIFRTYDEASAFIKLRYDN